jgi:hypothetical protein
MSSDTPFYANAPLDYTPQAPRQPQTPSVTYELTQDGTGKAPKIHVPLVITDRNGQKVTLPYPPKSKCNKCYGKGYVGYLVAKGTERNGRLVICAKCYPMIRGK